MDAFEDRAGATGIGTKLGILALLTNGSNKTGRYNVALFNSADPRGSKVGGIETYFRDYIFYHPDDMDILFIGADEIGDLTIGEITEIEFRGRRVKFLPLYFLENSVNNYTGTITRSETMTFARLLMKNWGKIRKILRDGNYSAEVHRSEYAPIIWTMGVPVIPMLHVWGGKGQQQSSVLGKYWYIRDAADLAAALTGKKFYAVNPDLTAMFKRRYPMLRKKFDTLTTWANTETFAPTPLKAGDTLDILYAGRMDRFKRPDIMFSVVAAAQQLSGNVRFHYVGDGDVEQFPEFAAIRDITTCHGSKSSAEVAALMRDVHVGILTSEFEGMPRFVMEMLSSGRPVVALHLPQLEPVVLDSVSGYLVPRGTDQIEELAKRLVDVRALIADGTIKPDVVRKVVEPFSPQALLGKIWGDHRELHGLQR